jgi:hypothetical protein
MEKNVESVIAFYDSIAPEYDTLMTDQDAEIRQQNRTCITSISSSLPRRIIIESFRTNPHHKTISHLGRSDCFQKR